GSTPSSRRRRSTASGSSAASGRRSRPGARTRPGKASDGGEAMYQPVHFREDRLEVQHALIRAHALGLLITSGPAGLLANPIPFLVDTAASERGTLRAHLARANPQLAELAVVTECLVVFQGPQHYISPSLYATKRENGKVVPTW